MRVSDIILLLFILSIVLLSFKNMQPIAVNLEEASVVEGSDCVFQTEYRGVWKRTASGADANNNRILDDAEIIKNPEPGAYDSIQFIDGSTIRISGMGMEVKDKFVIASIDGKRMCLISPNHDDLRKTSHKFEIVSYDDKKMVIVPPIYSFMLSVYTK